MLSQVPDHFVFNLRFEKHQHQAEPGVDADFPVANRDGAIHPGPLEMDVIAFPAIFDGELSGEVPGQFVGGGLGDLPGEAMVCVQVDVRHQTIFGGDGFASVDGHRANHQYPPVAIR